MNIIRKKPVNSLGYNFIDPAFIPAGKDEYYLRDVQNRSGIDYRQLTAYEIEVLVRNRNQSDNWNKILVSDAFTPELVKNCKFYGLVRIGKLEPYFLEFHNLRMPVGLYNSTIISCDFGDNVVVDNVNYMSHYIIGNDVMLVNINELATTSFAKFGNGILKEGEDEQIRIWMEVCNENGGRKIIPFNGMLPGDAFLWSRFRDDEKLQQRFIEFTDNRFDKHRGFYGKIGDRTVIKNTRIIKDVWMGSDAYIKGANKLKNLTIKSEPEAVSQIGEGCEMVNGIINEGCRIFYGVKAVRFVMASHSQLKYGARLINSYLGNNATISCCEVLNTLIFPAHEQHHNNSFLCASLVQGQSNMAAGATIGSNHNSRSADGELIAGRGFWPGLCVSVKHNSRFACFTILAKGDFPTEIDLSIPFSLVSNDVTRDRLVVMPGYWFMHNMYALARNAWKYVDRDRRIERLQTIEYAYLAPDSMSEVAQSIRLFQQLTGRAFYLATDPERSYEITECEKKGKTLLDDNDPIVDELEILAPMIEHSSRKVVIVKMRKAYAIFREVVSFYTCQQLMRFLQTGGFKTATDAGAALPQKAGATEWSNIGGQLIPTSEIKLLTTRIRNGKVDSWDAVHEFYAQQSANYNTQKLEHAIAIYRSVFETDLRKKLAETLPVILQLAIKTSDWMTAGIHDSRAKDYENRFRQMVYNNQAEMDAVIGKLDDNNFIQQEIEHAAAFRKAVKSLLRKYGA